MSRRVSILTLAILAGCAGAVEVDSDLPCAVPVDLNPMQDVDGNTLYWQRSDSWFLTVGSASATPELVRALETWNRAAEDCELPLYLVEGAGTGEELIGVRFFERYFPHDHQRAAVTTAAAHAGGKLERISIDVNVDYESNPAQETDLESVLLHELGHALGLDHVADEESVMHRAIQPGEMKRKLTPLDKMRLCQLYSCY